MKPRFRVRALLILVAVVAALSLSAGSLLAVSWIRAARISGTDTILGKDPVAIATSGDKVMVAWARSETESGISILERDGDVWPSVPFDLDAFAGQTMWSPSVAYAGSQASVVWTEGMTKTACTSQRQIREHLITEYPDKGTTYQVASGLYGNATAPDLVAGDTGWHVVFAAAASDVACGAGLDLYYSYRPFASTSWTPPTVVITRGQVVSATAVSAGIWFPRIAVAPGSATVDVVWEQFEQFEGLVSDNSIWAVSGTLQGTTVSWSTPVRLSPSWQDFAVRPTIAADASGQVHVAWSQLVGSWSFDSDQYVHYQMLGRGSPMSLNSGEPFHATKGSPALVGTSVAVLGDHVCVAWHGYTGTSGSEEITVRCSLDSGLRWRAPINVSESPTMLSIYPDISVDTSGTVHFAWVEYAFDGKWSPEGVYYRNSTWVTLLPLVSRGR